MCSLYEKIKFVRHFENIYVESTIAWYMPLYLPEYSPEFGVVEADTYRGSEESSNVVPWDGASELHLDSGAPLGKVIT